MAIATIICVYVLLGETKKIESFLSLIVSYVSISLQRRGVGEEECDKLTIVMQFRVLLGPGQPRSQGTLSTSRKYPGYGWSRVC